MIGIAILCGAGQLVYGWRPFSLQAGMIRAKVIDTGVLNNQSTIWQRIDLQWLRSGGPDSLGEQLQYWIVYD